MAEDEWLLKPVEKAAGVWPALAYDEENGQALTLCPGCPHAAVHSPLLLALKSSPSLWKERLLRPLSDASSQSQWEHAALSLGAPSDKQRRVSPRVHHMTATFHNRKAHQNSTCAQRQRPSEASTSFVSPHKRLKRPAVIAHDHLDDAQSLLQLAA